MGSLTLDTAYIISFAILTISTIVSRLELVIISSLYVDSNTSKRELNQNVLKWKVFNYVILICSFFSGLLFFCNEHILFKFFFYLTAIGLIYSYSVKKTSKDGSDQIRVLAYFSFILCLLLDNEIGKVITIGSLGVQGLIAYTTSGLTKVFSKHWKKEDILIGSLGTYSYGTPNTLSFLKKSPLLEKLLSHLTTAAMLAIPICFFIPYQYPLLVALGCILVFHFSTAVLVGLNDFLFTFPLTYPGILILHSLIFSF
ncbi:Rossmann-fold NAD(P)-binding domain-containing protein [Flavivirga eckloniae]|uniref:HTTM domain-containing protein n=1 Tax=Flavivirga eckloniae TaxID=1803846 RepID=A0A2K9PNG4_9FLAO|nr:hypothetical protein [Flavivirga eckloniae]AUP78599.1 hypothetical protein C1H87_07690 [Flavivirga eckloniae]